MNIKNISIFFAGAASGFGAAYFILKNIFTNKFNEEVRAVKSSYKLMKEELTKNACPEDYDDLKEELENYKKIVLKTCSSNLDNIVDDQTVDNNFIFVDESFYGSFGASTRTFVTYLDDIYVDDETEEIIDDIDDYIGPEIHSELKNKDFDSLYVKDISGDTVYEIIKDHRTYKEATSYMNVGDDFD